MVTHCQTFVCPACIDEDAIRAFIEEHAEDDTCSYCDATSKQPIAASLEEVADFIEQGLSSAYEDPANSMSYCSAEGGYLGTTYDIHELLTDELGIDFPNDSDGELLDAICRAIEIDTWCQRDPNSLSPVEQLTFSWEQFCKVTKYQRRYFFLKEEREDRETLNPAEVLESIFSFAESQELFASLPKGTPLFRARSQAEHENFRSALELGPPPVEKATQTNRMSPPGIVMMYASEEVETALAETASGAGTFVVGEFVTEREALILDLTKLPATPSIFEEIPETLEYDPRPRLAFLHHIARDISRPIARDDKVHVEYVPTQIVTEYLRTVTTFDGRPIEGIRYRSSRRRSGSSLVIFADQSNLVLPLSQRDTGYGLYKDRWIRLARSRVARVTAEQVKTWSSQDRP